MIFFWRVMVHSTIPLTNHFHEVYTNRAIDREKKTSHRIHTGWNYTEQIGLISREPVPDRCRLSAEASLFLLRQKLIVNADVSQTFSALKVDFSRDKEHFFSFYLSLAFSFTLMGVRVCARARAT